MKMPLLCAISQNRLFKVLKNQLKTIRNIGNDLTVSTISASHIKEKLLKEKIQFSDGFTCYKLSECLFCGPLRKKSVGTRNFDVFINKHTGFFLCELCRCTGPWDVFEKLIDCEKVEGGKEIQNVKNFTTPYYEKGNMGWKQIVGIGKPLHELPEDEYKTVLQMFNLIVPQKSVLEKLNIYVTSDHLYFPMYASSQLVGFMSLDKNDLCITTPKKDCAGYLFFAPKKKMSTAVVVSNIQDFFVMLTLNLQSHLICLPYGVTNLPQIMLPFFENYDSLTLWLGSLTGAWDATKSFSKKLNEKRCFVVRGLDTALSPVDALNKGFDIIKILKDAPATWHQSITTFASLRSDVLIELRNHDQVLGTQWRRFPTLNRILKGHRRGELTVLTGPTGSGKTTFMSEYSLDLASQGINTLWGSFEVRNVRLARTMLQQHVGQPLENNLQEYDKLADEFEKLPIYFLTFHGQQSIKAVMDAVKHAAYVHDIAHVIIDNVQFMIGMSEESKYVDRFYKQDLIIHCFRTFATKSNCHVTLVIHPRKEKESEDLTTSSIFGGAKAAQEADNVFIIQDKRLTSVKGKKYLQVTKNRYTGDLGIMPLEFDRDSLSFQKKKPKIEIIEEKSHNENVIHN